MSMHCVVTMLIELQLWLCLHDCMDVKDNYINYVGLSSQDGFTAIHVTSLIHAFSTYHRNSALDAYTMHRMYDYVLLSFHGILQMGPVAE